eukprot:313179-Amphidinium_carterae.2
MGVYVTKNCMAYMGANVSISGLNNKCSPKLSAIRLKRRATTPRHITLIAATPCRRDRIPISRRAAERTAGAGQPGVSSEVRGDASTGAPHDQNDGSRSAVPKTAQRGMPAKTTSIRGEGQSKPAGTS